MKKILGVALLICAGILIFWFVSGNKEISQVSEVDYKDISYSIQGTPTMLVKSQSGTVTAPGSTITQYFGNEVAGDVNEDGLPDIAFLITQSGSGTGTFYYAVVALKTAQGYSGSNGVFLGDRIAPQTIEIKDGQIIVNYADRKAGEPMTTNPSVGVSKYLEMIGGVLVEIR